MGNLSLGSDNITPKESAIFLQYLNLAHFELYQMTANLNEDLLVKQTLASVADSNTVELDEKPFFVNNVYDTSNKRKLKKVSLTDILSVDPSFSVASFPVSFFVQKNTIQFFPKQTGVVNVDVWYVPQPTQLTAAMQDIDLPYPIAYQNILIDGALYYLFQEEGGFKNIQKASGAQSRWEIGKSKMVSYFYNSSGTTFSTYSNV